MGSSSKSLIQRTAMKHLALSLICLTLAGGLAANEMEVSKSLSRTFCCGTVARNCAIGCNGKSCDVQCGGRCGIFNFQCGPYKCSAVTNACVTSSAATTAATTAAATTAGATTAAATTAAA